MSACRKLPTVTCRKKKSSTNSAAWLTKGVFCTLLVALLHQTAFAGATGTFVGRVSDSSGAVITGAKVILRNTDTNAARETWTSPLGEYVFSLVAPGNYEIRTEVQGFRPANRRSSLDVDDTSRLDFTLYVSSLTETSVRVTAASPLVQTESSALGQVISRSFLSELPLNERNFLAFTLLGPGTQEHAEGSQLSLQGGAISINGGREQSNNFLLDGVDNNDPLISQFGVLPSVDAIEEFKVQSSGSSAEFGRSGAGQINVVLRGGGNELRGSLFALARNRHLDAKNFFDLPGPIPRLDRQQFGGTLSGPIRRDKTFFFLSYETLHLRQATTREAAVPSQVERQAALAAIPAPFRNPAGINVFNLLPAANVGPDLRISDSFLASPVIRDTSYLPTVKLETRLGSTGMLSGYYALYNDDRFNPYEPLLPFTNLPGYGSFWANRGQSIGVTWTRVFSSRTANELRFGFNRRRGDILPENAGRNGNQQLGFPTVKTAPEDLAFPIVFLAGFDGIGESRTTPQGRRDNTFQWADMFAWNPAAASGRHRLKFGADIRHVRANGFLDVLARGEWFFLGVTGDPLQDLLLGFPAFALAGEGDSSSALRTTQSNFFAQDDLRVTSRLTLNFGLRYEYNSPVIDADNRLSAPDLSSNSTTCAPRPDCQFIVAGTQGLPRATYNHDTNNFAPRIGLAWRPFSSDQLVIRSAYGIFYDFTLLNANLLPRFNPPFFHIGLFLNDGTKTIQTILSQAAAPSPPVAVRIEPHLRDPYLQQWNLNLQWQVASSTLVEAAYVGSKGTHLVLTRNANQAAPGTGAFPFPQFGPFNQIESSGASSYHSLQLRAERRLAGGLAFLGGYTWSRSIDDASALFGASGESGIPQDSFNLSADRGLSSFHSEHRFVGSPIYALPFGKNQRWLKDHGTLAALAGNWRLSAITTLQTGKPFTVNRGMDQSMSGTPGLGIFADRPNLIADPFRAGPVAANPDPLCRTTISNGGRAADRVRTTQTWFNACAFASPGVAFGNAGRNAFIGPGLANSDISALKEIEIGREGHRLQFRVDFFNLFNHPNFDLPNRIFDSRTFGEVRSSNANGDNPPRQVQLALRYSF